MGMPGKDPRGAMGPSLPLHMPGILSCPAVRPSPSVYSKDNPLPDSLPGDFPSLFKILTFLLILTLPTGFYPTFNSTARLCLFLSTLSWASLGGATPGPWVLRLKDWPYVLLCPPCLPSQTVSSH